MNQFISIKQSRSLEHSNVRVKNIHIIRQGVEKSSGTGKKDDFLTTRRHFLSVQKSVDFSEEVLERKVR